MPQEQVKNTAITPVAFDYQIRHGVYLLSAWLSSPTRYRRVMFEGAEEAPQSLDDIVAERADGRFDCWQVKYTPNAENNAFTWDWLLEVTGKTARSRCNLKKWFDALQKIDADKIGTIQLITNKVPDRHIEICLAGGRYLDLAKAPESIQRRVDAELGGRKNAEWLFSQLQVVHSDKGYLNLEYAIYDSLQRFTDRDGVDRLLNQARKWTFEKETPPPDGWITLDAVKSIISNKRPRPIPEDFTIPEGYEVPYEEFHLEFVAEIESGTKPILVLTGPPGRGKSTYLSYLCETFEERSIPYIRHHYFLSLADRDDRLSPYVVKESLLRQIERFHSQVHVGAEGDVDLFEVLAKCAANYKAQQKPFVVVIDGLDHVWRDNAGDKRPLDDLFRQLLLVPDNLVLIVGTQPVSDTQLPRKLLIHAPRQDWKLLPVMSEISVMRYLQAQLSCGRLFMQHNNNTEEEQAECARLMHQMTGGHPLHLIYATGHLVNNGEGLSKWSVEHIPGDLSKDAETYYRSLWVGLSHVQKDILILLAEFRFYWPRMAFVSPMLLPENHSEANVHAVEHLLHSTVVGLQPFHESLIVFIKNTAEYTARVQILIQGVLQWMAGEAPDRLKNTWLWIVQARTGTPDPLITGLTRDWVLDRLATGYPTDAIIEILTEAEEAAFDLRRYADAYRLRHLKTRILNGPEFQIPDATRLKICSWKCADDGSVLDEAFASRDQLSIVEVTALGQALQWKQLGREANACGKDALRRHRGDSRFAVDRRDSNQKDETLYLGRVFAELNTIDVERIGLNGAFNSGDVRLTAAFVNGLVSCQDLARIMALRTGLIRPSRKKLAEDAAIRVAALQGAQIHSWAEFNSFRHSTIAGCWAQLIGMPLDAYSCTPFPENWRDYTSNESLTRMTHEWFFKTILVAFTAGGKFSWLSLTASQDTYFPEVVSYLDRVAEYAENVAMMWRRKTPVAFHQFYEFFADLNPPGKNEPNKHYRFEEFCKTLIPIAMDCQLLSSALGGATLIDATSLEAAAKSPWLNLHHFRESYAQNGIKLLTDDGAKFLIDHGRAYLSQWDETCEYSRALLEMCEIALLHEMDSEARQLCRLCWDYVLGYGHRKDPTMLTLLDAIEYLADDAPDFCRSTLAEIAPQIHHITDYTDGKGTQQALSYADNLLVKLDLSRLAEKYADHVSSGDWRYADECFTSLFTGDITSPFFEALARTGLPKEAVDNLRKRVQKGDQRAAELLDVANSHVGASFGTIERQDVQNKSEELRAFEGKPEEYPPVAFTTLLSEMRESGTYDMYSYLPSWYEYWAAQGRESDLLQTLEPLLLSEEARRDDVKYMLDLAFETCLKLRGKASAFRYAVQAQKEMGGWSDFYESSDKSLHRLYQVAELYPEHADEFIALSCFSMYRRKHKSSAKVIPNDKLVYFLVRLGRVEEAMQLVRAMVQSVLEDTRHLPLTHPVWANVSEREDSSAQIRFLVVRSRWPVPAVKWWSLQQLANLLNSEFTGIVETELYRALDEAKLETEVAELLCCFWLAKQDGYKPSVVLPRHIHAQSPLSTLILGDLVEPLLFEGSQRAPLLLAPYGYQAAVDFEEAQGTTVPRIYRTLLEHLEHPQLPPFVKQYAFEWDNTSHLYPEAPFQSDVGYFLGYASRSEMTGQFVPRATQRGRSAFLRTLAVAQDICNAPQNLIDDNTLVALPVDPTFAALTPSKPDWLPAWETELSPISREIERFIIETITQMSVSEPGTALLALSTPLNISENRIINLQVIRWVQWEDKPLDAEELITRHRHQTSSQNLGWCHVKGMQKTTVIPVVPLNNLIDPETCAAPTAFEPGRWRRGYLHSALDSRGLFFPASTVAGTEIRVRPVAGQVELQIGTSGVGGWEYWNAGWHSSHPKGAKAFCGTALTLTTDAMHSLWENAPVKHLYVWKCTMLHREASYDRFTCQHNFGTFAAP